MEVHLIMESSLERVIADSLECDDTLLPFMPELLEDLLSLGSDPDTIAEMLEPYIGPGSRVLDLACGKGAVSVVLATRLGCKVLGIDGMPAFINAAKQYAAKQGVGHLCDFHCGDIRTFRPDAHFYDAVIYGAAGPALGEMRACMTALRGRVRNGGFVVIDDAFRRSNHLSSTVADRIRDLPTREEFLHAFTAYGDKLIEEREFSPEKLKATNRMNNHAIACRTARLAERHPKQAALFCSYMSRQYYECHILEQCCQCATWLIQVQKKPSLE